MRCGFADVAGGGASGAARCASAGVSRLRSRRGGIVRAAFFLGLFVAAAGTLVWMLAFPWGFGAKLEKDTGCAIVADRIFCNPFGFEFRLGEAELGNSAHFGDNRPMMKIRSLRGKARFSSLGSNRIVVERAAVDISRLTLVIDESGKLNLSEFMSDLFGEARGLGEGMEIARADLKIDTVEILDYSQPRPTHKALKLGVDVEDFEAEGAIGLFRPLFDILIRAEYLPVDYGRKRVAETIASN